MQSARQRPHQVKIRLSDDERADLEALAKATGCTLSQAIRLAVSYARAANMRRVRAA